MIVAPEPLAVEALTERHMAGQVVGTVPYMAPEMIDAQHLRIGHNAARVGHHVVSAGAHSIEGCLLRKQPGPLAPDVVAKCSAKPHDFAGKVA